MSRYIITKESINRLAEELGPTVDPSSIRRGYHSNSDFIKKVGDGEFNKYLELAFIPKLRWGDLASSVGKYFVKQDYYGSNLTMTTLFIYLNIGFPEISKEDIFNVLEGIVDGTNKIKTGDKDLNKLYPRINENLQTNTYIEYFTTAESLIYNILVFPDKDDNDKFYIKHLFDSFKYQYDELDFIRLRNIHDKYMNKVLDNDEYYNNRYSKNSFFLLIYYLYIAKDIDSAVKEFIRIASDYKEVTNQIERSVSEMLLLLNDGNASIYTSYVIMPLLNMLKKSQYKIKEMKGDNTPNIKFSEIKKTLHNISKDSRNDIGNRFNRTSDIVVNEISRIEEFTRTNSVKSMDTNVYEIATSSGNIFSRYSIRDVESTVSLVLTDNEIRTAILIYSVDQGIDSVVDSLYEILGDDFESFIYDTINEAYARNITNFYSLKGVYDYYLEYFMNKGLMFNTFNLNDNVNNGILINLI